MDKDTRQSETPSILSRMASAAREYAVPLTLVTALSTAFAERAHASDTVVDSNGHTWSCDNDVDDLDGDGVNETNYNDTSVYAFSGVPGGVSTRSVLDGSLPDTEFSTDGIGFSSMATQVQAVDAAASTGGFGVAGYSPDYNEAALRVFGGSIYLVDDYASGSWTLSDLGAGFSGSYGSVDNTGTKIAVYDARGSDVDVTDWTSDTPIYDETGDQAQPVIDSASDRLGVDESRSFYVVNNLSSTQDKDLLVAGAFPVQYLSADNSPLSQDTFVYITNSDHATPYQALYCVDTDSAPTVVVTDTDGDSLTDEEEAALGTDPSLADTDGDGVDDAAEVLAGTDPLVSDVVEDTGTDTGSGDTGTDTGSGDTGGDTGTDTGTPCEDAEGSHAAPAELCLDGGSAVATSGDPSIGSGEELVLDDMVDGADGATVDSTSDGDASPVPVLVDLGESYPIIPALVHGHASVVLGTESNFAGGANPPSDSGEPTVYAKWLAMGVDESTGEASTVEVTNEDGSVTTIKVSDGEVALPIAAYEEDTGKPVDTGDDTAGETGGTVDTDDTDSEVIDSGNGDTDSVQADTGTDDPTGCACASTNPSSGLVVLAGFGAVALAGRRKRSSEEDNAERAEELSVR